MKKYSKIKNKNINLERYIDRGFIVQEKIDGSNGSFTFEDDKLQVFSRRLKLDPENNLNNFYQYIHNFYNNLPDDKKEELKILLNDYILFGEWLTKHKIHYIEDCYNEFYLFDVYEKQTMKYLSYNEVKRIADKFNFMTPKVFLHVSPEEVLDITIKDIVDLAGKSNLTVPKNSGEGVVVKYLDGKNKDEEYYKIVTDKFKETNNQKKTNKKDFGVADFAITKARFEKIMFKAIDEGRLSESDLEFEQFSKIMKECINDFVDDIIDEELDLIIEKVKKQIKKKAPHVLREILKEKTSNYY